MAQTLNAAVLSRDAQFTRVIRDTLSPAEIDLVGPRRCAALH